MEILAELVVELVGLALNATVGFGLAAATYWLWVTVRRRLWGLDRAALVETPDGEMYSLEVPGLRIRTPLSRRLFKSDSTDRQAPPEWNNADRLHPVRVAERVDEALIVVVPFLLVGVVVLVLIFVLELILAVIVLGLVSVAATLIRHRWTCVVTSPSGREFQIRAKGLRRIRRSHDELAEAIRIGDLTVLEAAGEH